MTASIIVFSTWPVVIASTYFAARYAMKKFMAIEESNDD